MKRMVGFELKRAVKSRGFWISLLMGCAIAVWDLILFYQMYRAETKEHNALEAWLGTDYHFACNSLFYVLLPILAALPYAGSYYLDRKSGYIKNICTRTSRKNYYVAKYCAVFLSAMAAVMLPLLFSLFLCMGVYPMRRPDRLLFLTAGVLDVNLMPELFGLHPTVYCILFTLIDGVFAGMLSIFSICIAERVESLFSAITVPFAVYILWSVLFVGGQTDNWSLLEMLNPLQRYLTYAWQLWLSLGVGLVCAWIWLFFKAKGKDIL